MSKEDSSQIENVVEVFLQLNHAKLQHLLYDSIRILRNLAVDEFIHFLIIKQFKYSLCRNAPTRHTLLKGQTMRLSQHLMHLFA